MPPRVIDAGAFCILTLLYLATFISCFSLSSLLVAVALAIILNMKEVDSTPSHPPQFWVVILFLVYYTILIISSRYFSGAEDVLTQLISVSVFSYVIISKKTEIVKVCYIFSCLTLISMIISLALLFAAISDLSQHGWTIDTPTQFVTRRWMHAAGIPALVVPNDITFLAMLAPLSLTLIYLHPRSPIAGASTVSIFLTLFTSGLYISRTSIMVLVLSCAFSGLLIRSRYTLIFITASLFLIICIDLLGSHILLDKFLNLDINPASGRMHHWSVAFQMFLDEPLFGHGLQTFNDANITWAHNLYLEVLAEQGVVGLVILLALLCVSAAGLWKTRMSTIREDSVVATGALGSMLGFVLASAFELTLFRGWALLMLLVLAALAARPAAVQVHA